MKLSGPIILSRAVLICVTAVTVGRVSAQALPPDVGLVTKLSGEVNYWESGYHEPAKAQSFMKIRRGDRFEISIGAVVQFIYFLGGRQETWKGPVALTVGDSLSATKGEKGVQVQPKVVIFPARATQSMRRIPVLLRRTGLDRPGAPQIRADIGESPATIALTQEEKAEITVARETYRALRKQAAPDDITPELYLLGIFTDYEQYGEMEGVIEEALRRQPDNEILQGLKEWVHARSSQGRSPGKAR
jgi:hypothetical protein